MTLMTLDRGRLAAGLFGHELPYGRGWTLASALGEFLAELEARYGPRDPSYTILGVEFGPGVPHVWYPGNRRHVAVKLSEVVMMHPPGALFELAHEAVHLLAPLGRAGAPRVEEGLATIYAEEQVAKGHAQGVTTAKYASAASLLRIALAVEPDLIRRLRSIEPAFSRWTPALFAEHAPAVEPGLASALCRPFSQQ